MEETNKILIVEDEAIIALDLKKRLVSLGYKVAAIGSNGEEGIKLAKELSPDLILMDIVMQGEMDGIKAAETIKSETGIPVIFLTAHLDEDTLQRAKTAGSYGYLTKPFEIKDLQNAIEIALYKSQTEQRLIASELKYRMLFMTATDAVITLDMNGFITSYNAKTLEMFGYKTQDIDNRQIKLLLPDVFLNNLAEGAKRILDVGKPAVGNMIETRARKRDGSSFPIELSFSMWELEGERTFTLIIRDIGLRRASELALKKAKEELEIRVEERTAELKALIDQSPFPIRVFNLDGNPIEENKAWRALWKNGKSAEKYNIFTDSILERNQYLPEIRKIFRDGGDYVTKPLFFEPEDFPYIGKPGGSLLIFHYYGVTNETGLVHRVVELIEDVTQNMIASEVKKELTEQKTRSVFMLDNIEEERRRISRELHDGIGQILFAAKFNLEVFEKDSNINNKNVAEAKNLITSANKELRNIIYSLHPVVIDNYGLKAALEMFLKEFAEVTSIEVDYNLDDLSQRFSSKTELTIFRIIQEIFNNIRKHSQASSASLKIYYKNGLINISAQDNGSGFNASQKLKDPERVSFGLVNIRQRVENLEGIFQIESEPGKGTGIYIEFPLGENDAHD